MKTTLRVLVFLFVTQLCLGNTAYYLNTPKPLLAKNHDGPSGHGMLIQNLPGQEKTAYGFHTGAKAQWTSIYGSITFNQLGKEFPLGGINEAGLVVEQLFLGTSVFPESDLPSLTELEWIQYQLDNYGSVDEVLSNLNRLRIRPLETVHFIIADPCGQSMIIDFSDGKPQVFRKNGGFQVMSHAPTDLAINYHSERQKHAEKLGGNPLDRFSLLSGYLENYPGLGFKEAFDLLDITSNQSGNPKTQWNIIYDLEDRCIYFKTNSFSQVRKVCLSEFVFDPGSIGLGTPIQIKNLQWNPLTINSHVNLLTLGLKHSQLKLDEEGFVQHLLDPAKASNDTIYQKMYVDLVIRFITNKPSGLVSYIFKPGQHPSQSTVGMKSGQFLVEQKETIRIIYNMPKVELALACFQDTDFKGVAESRIEGSAGGYSYLRTQSYHSGNIPKYVDTKIDLRHQSDFTVRIK